MKTLKLLILALSLTNLVYSQDRILTGQVVDSEFKPLISAIVLKNTGGQGIRTNEQGFFQLVISSEVTEIQIQYIGYRTENVKIKNKCHINIIMFGDLLVDWKSVGQEEKYFQKKRRALRKSYKKAIINGLLQEEKECE